MVQIFKLINLISCALIASTMAVDVKRQYRYEIAFPNKLSKLKKLSGNSDEGYPAQHIRRKAKEMGFELQVTEQFCMENPAVDPAKPGMVVMKNPAEGGLDYVWRIWCEGGDCAVNPEGNIFCTVKGTNSML